MKEVKILVSSLGKNADLAQELKKLTEAQDATAEVINLADLNLPLYTTKEAENGIPQAAKDLADKLRSISAFIFVAPEYNGSIPPVMSNTMAWISGTGENWREVFNGKVAAIATHSGGGGLHGLMAMRQQLSYIGMNVLGRQLCTNYQKDLSEKSANAIIKNLLELS